MRFTIPEEIKSTLPKSLFYNYYSQIKSNQMLVFDERGKPEYPGKNLSWQSLEDQQTKHIWHWVRESNPGQIDGRQVLSPLGQPCHQFKPNSTQGPALTSIVLYSQRLRHQKCNMHHGQSNYFCTYIYYWFLLLSLLFKKWRKRT